MLRLIWLAATILLLITWWHVFALVSESRSKELATAERDLANLTRVSQEHADRTFRSADQVIRFIQARYLEIGDRLDLTALSNQGVIDTEIFPQVGIIDAQGIYTLANRPINGRLDLSDREHFKVHVAADTGELFVSKPVLGRSTGKWSIQLTRRITRANGEFAGVVVVSIDPGYFTRFYSELKLGTQGVVALYGLDGVARARKVGGKEEFGTQAGNSLMFERIARGELEGAYTARSVVDGIERMYYFRKLPRYALVVADGLDIKYLMDNHQRAKEALWLQAALVSLLILALAVALTRYFKRIGTEITARQLAQRLIEERNEQLNAIFSLSPDGFISFDGERRVKYVSPAFTRMTGFAESTVIGCDESVFSELLADACEPASRFPGIAKLRTMNKAEVGGTANERRQTIELAGAGKRVLEVGLRESDAESVSQILYLRDITHETEVDRLKSEFLSTAAHELRTPMASIFGFTELLMTQQFEETDRNDFLGTIYRQSELMISIINELLDLSRIEARRGKDFTLASVDVRHLMHEIAAGFKTPQDRPPPQEPPGNGPLWVRADRQKLTQAVSNVLSNAYKYSPGGGAVMIELCEAPGDNDTPPRIGIRIADQGIGMTHEQLARVCERFYRADVSGKIPGTGLGMSIVKEIIELHGGELEFSSQLGVGSAVTLWLPGVSLHILR
ncbi:MAG: ATP-binding protein [Proteobacteria bacterium]|nr:ATP-binding protein [Pseudomonadota bacterium]